MTQLLIDVVDISGGTHPDDKVRLWAPQHRPDGERVVSTSPVDVKLTDGQATVEVLPGPARVQIMTQGVVDSAPKRVTIPDEASVTLRAVIEDGLEWEPEVINRVATLASRAELAATRAETVADTFGSLEGVATSVQAAEDAAVRAETGATTVAGHATQTADDRRQTGEDRQAAAQSATNAATSADESATHEDTSLDAAAAAIAAAWSFDGFTPAQVSDAVLRAEAAAVRAEAVASGGGIAVVGSEEEAAALPIGTVYVIAEVAPGEPAPVTVVGTVGENITTDTFTPTIPNATLGDTIIIAANTKAVGGSTLTAPTGFTTLVDGYWAGTQRSWVLTGPWSDDLTITADQPLEFAYAAVAVRGATSVTAGTVKDRVTEPAESVTVTAPAVERGTNDLAIGIAFERTSPTETAEQVTVNEGWTIEHYTAQGANFQTTLIGVGGTGDMVATYPNVQATNGAGVQVVAHA